MSTQKKPTGPDLSLGVPFADIPDGGMIGGHVEDEAVLVARHGNELFALSAKCTHYGGPLAKGVLSGDGVRCPWHHACFSLRTGEAVRAPAIDPVARWRVERVGDKVFVREKLERANPKRRPSAPAPGRIVIVGGGAAGFAAAERLRREGFAGELSILSASDALPVDRPNLSKDYLAGKAPEDWVFLKPQRFYDDNAISLELRSRVTRIDARERQVHLASGKFVSFDRLLLATGAEPLRPHIPGAELPHVFTLRSFADSKAIVARAEKAKTVVVIGASFIGLEVAASLIQRGLQVHIVAPEKRPLARILGDDLADLVRTIHEEHGAVFHLGSRPATIEAGHVKLDTGGTLVADFVVLGVGVRPRTDLAHAAGLKIDNGVAVDAYLETSAQGIFAAGDIARFPYPLDGGRHIRVEHFVVAQRLGQLAALNMLGAGQAYNQAPFFWSQHHDLTINYVGHASHWDGTEIEGDLKGRDGLVKYRSGGKLLAVASVNRDEASLRAELELEAG